MYNVWIVDDEPFILEGLAAVVDWPSMQMTIAGQAENGMDALAHIDEQKAQVDILITDIAMPEMNGLDLIRTLKSRNPELRSIILSGYDDFDYVKEGMRLGIENYLLKPVNLEELNQTLTTTVEKLNRSRMEALSQDQIDMLKDNILYRWMTGRIGKEQWSIRSDFLQLRLSEPYAAVAIVKPDPEQNGMPAGLAYQTRKLAGRFLAEHGVPALVFQDIDDNTVLVVGTKDESVQTKAWLQNRLSQLTERITEQFGISPLVALGTLETGFESAPASYRNAWLTLDYALLFPHEQLLIYESVTAYVELKGTQLGNLDAYTKLLLAFDEEAVDRQIDEDFDRFTHAEGVTPQELRSAAVEMIIQMKKLLKDFKRNETISHAYHDVMNRVFRSTSLEQLKSHVRYIAKEVMQALSGHQDHSPVIRQILEFVQTSYREDFSLKTLGAAYRIHPVYLGQLFQKEMNQTFSDYVNRFRIGKAMELIKRTDMKAHDVAKAVGYWDTAHFYKHFKKYVGVPPSQYRQMM